MDEDPTTSSGSAPPAAPPAPGVPAPPPSRDRRIAKRVLVGVAVASLVGVWAYAFWAGNQPLVDRMDDLEVATRAEQICSVTVAANKELPPAYDMTSAAQRADVIEESDVRLTAMVAELDALEPTTARDVAMWDEWIADWHTYLGDREDYVERLRQDPEARFYVTEKERDQVTAAVDRFAQSNRMLSCATPTDVGG